MQERSSVPKRKCILSIDHVYRIIYARLRLTSVGKQPGVMEKQQTSRSRKEEKDQEVSGRSTLPPKGLKKAK